MTDVQLLGVLLIASTILLTILLGWILHRTVGL